jgi:hypothetical protein
MAEGENYGFRKRRFENAPERHQESGIIDGAKYKQAIGRALLEHLVDERVGAERHQSSERPENTVSKSVLRPTNDRYARQRKTPPHWPGFTPPLTLTLARPLRAWTTTRLSGSGPL